MKLSASRAICMVQCFAVVGGCGSQPVENSKPATPAEAAQVLDLRTFPLAPGATSPNRRDLSSLHYEAHGKVPEAFGFIQKELAAQKWQKLADGFESDQSSSGSFERDGYRLSVSVSSAYGTDSAGKVHVQIINHGNVDLSQLPTPDGVTSLYNMPTVSSYVTPASVDETVAAVRELLLAEGWQPYGVAGDSYFFRKNAVRLSARVLSAPGQDGKTVIDYSSLLLSLEIPLPPDVVQSQYTDSPPQLSFDSTGSLEDVSTFYRQRLAEHGWKATTDELIEIGFHHVVIFRNPQKDMLEVKLNTVEGKTRGLVQFSTAAEIAAMEERIAADVERKKTAANKPKPKLAIAVPVGAEKVDATPSKIKFTFSTGKARAAVETLQKQLVAAGWATQNATLEAMFGTVSLEKDGKSVSLTYVETGVLPPEITISCFGIELEVANK